MLPVFLFSARILKLLGQEGNIAIAAGYLSLWFIPVLFFMALHITIQQYLQAQLKNMIVGWLSALSFMIHVLLSWIFVTKLNMGIPGAMGAMILSNWFILIGEVVYVVGGWCPETWKGFTLAAFSDLLPILKLSISSGIMVCLEVWYNAVLVLLAGYMDNAKTQISAFSICLNISAWNFTLCVGFLVAVSVRVANELGAGNVRAAIFSIKVTLSTTISIQVLFWILCLIFGRVAIGAGSQTVVAYVNICSYYVLGVPIGLLLGYVAHLQVKGIWIGMLIGVVMQTLTLGYITLRTDWNEQVNKASQRLRQWLLRPSSEEDYS
ncbi:hypothetical protein Tsubulata_004759 [Turnera subulata]|uniref:Polysaccharide biosynthesis protein C-terminal domain-containing protein n=1 Tax=Turnera subulata TaxID=218843 RepID=A0A9Q0FHS1_9ROSI|nr:hypothetical protein Tsubulata_004759 [Turnera subulata]